MTDEELIEYFANCKDTDPIPTLEGMSPREGVQRMIYQLVDLGVMPEPRPTDLFIDVLHDARDACKRRLADG